MLSQWDPEPTQHFLDVIGPLEFFTAPSPGSIWTVLDFNIGWLLQCFCCVFWDCKKICIVLIAIFALATILKRLFYVEWDDPSIFTEHSFQLQINMKTSMLFTPIFLATKPHLKSFPFQDRFRLQTSRQICLAKIFAQIDVPMKVSANDRESVSYISGKVRSWACFHNLVVWCCFWVLVLAWILVGQDMWMRFWLAFKPEYRFQCNQLLICAFERQLIQLQGVFILQVDVPQKFRELLWNHFEIMVSKVVISICSWVAHGSSGLSVSSPDWVHFQPTQRGVRPQNVEREEQHVIDLFN